MNYNTLTPEEERIIVHKGTERPFTGALLDNKAKGLYVKDATHHCIHPNQNLIRFAGGQALTMKYRAQ